ncbi:hypothetical protein [Streptomyces rubrogriseus]|uniref:hypothetical protein n=1 Tax=Streptomyces rubrogriseus TaxID=194673 RepID=UPI0037B56F28
MLDAVQRAAEALSGSDSMQAVLESTNHVANSQAVVLNTAINAQTEMLGQDWADHVSHAWDAAETTWHDHVAEASEALSRSTQQHLNALAQISLTFDITGLDRMFAGLDAWQALDLEQRTAVTRALDDSHQDAADGSDTAASEDLIAGLEETARDFASAQTGPLSSTLQRQLFVYCCGLLVLMVLMQASFTSDTADAVIDKTSTLMPAAGAVMLAAGAAWDRYVRRPEDDDAEGDRVDQD